MAAAEVEARAREKEPRWRSWWINEESDVSTVNKEENGCLVGCQQGLEETEKEQANEYSEE